jgi:hypothetical protein
LFSAVSLILLVLAILSPVFLLVLVLGHVLRVGSKLTTFDVSLLIVMSYRESWRSCGKEGGIVIL